MSGRVLLPAMLALLGAGVALPAAADDRDLRAGMREYFAGEKGEAWYFLGTGVVSLGAGTALFLEGSDLARGASYPMGVFGLGQAAAGIVLLVRTDAQVAALGARLATDPAGMREDELRRMRRVGLQFDILMVAELVFVVGGSATWYLAEREDAHTLAGVGLGLAAEGAVTFVLDYLAARRARGYTRRLVDFRVDAGADRSAAVVVGGVY